MAYFRRAFLSAAVLFFLIAMVVPAISASDVSIGGTSSSTSWADYSYTSPYLEPQTTEPACEPEPIVDQAPQPQEESDPAEEMPPEEPPEEEDPDSPLEPVVKIKGKSNGQGLGLSKNRIR
ncbi:MAG: hypothetical protein JSV56_00695 [Methanomassiliicoccales archaeon]|nr:MAG: hypothetical protein JSV56_00695 [Methanomassiliicoccales archaeon]